MRIKCLEWAKSHLGVLGMCNFGMFSMAHKGHLKCLAQYIEEGTEREEPFDIDYEVNKKNIDERTPLILACIAGQYDYVKKLLKMGADIEARDNHNKTALDYSSFGMYNNICSLLMMYKDYGNQWRLYFRYLHSDFKKECITWLMSTKRMNLIKDMRNLILDFMYRNYVDSRNYL